MRYFSPLAIALALFVICPRASAAGSLAARVQAASQARRSLAAQPVDPSSLAPITGPDIQQVPPPSAPSQPERGSSRRINVADWFHDRPRKAPDRPATGLDAPDEPPVGDEDPPVVALRPRNSAAPSSPPRDPLPLPTEPTGGKTDRGAPPLGPELTPPMSLEPAPLSTADDTLTPLEKSPPRDMSPETVAEEDTADDTADDTLTPLEKSPPRDMSPETVAEEDDATKPPKPEQDPVTESDEEVIRPAKPARKFSPELVRLRDRVRSTLSFYFQRAESVEERSPWGIMHTLIAFGADTELVAGRQRVNAIGWLCYNRSCRGMQLLRFDGQYPVPQNGPGFQGHEGQFLSMLALSGVKSNYPLRVDGRELTVQELIEYEKVTCRAKSELSFKLIGLSYYLPSDATWTAKGGEEWSIPRLLEEELVQPINGATCGGTHRLIGYSMAVKVRQKRREPLDGQWARAHRYVDGYHKYAMQLQNRDGSFSTNWFKGRQGLDDLNRRIQTTGHVLEWLVFSLPAEELTDARIVRAVNYLNSALWNSRRQDTEIGPRGHAVRALALYNERVFGDKPGERRALLARLPEK